MLSPLHRALMAPLTTSLTRDDCAPAVFLLSHAKFDSHSLRIAADIYRSLPNGRGLIVAEALSEEAQARLAREVHLLRTAATGGPTETSNLKGNG